MVSAPSRSSQVDNNIATPDKTSITSNNRLSEEELSYITLHNSNSQTEANKKTIDNTGFEQQRRQKKKQKKVIKGKGEVKQGFGGAPEPNRSLFVYRANSDTSEEIVSNHIKSKGFQVIEVVGVSHGDSKFKSFKVTIPVSSVEPLLSEDLWPEGICVRRFYSTPQPWRTKSK